MATAKHAIDVVLLGREYRVACTADEAAALRQAVDALDRRLREIQSRSRGASTERVAVMAALNMTHEMLAAGQKNGDENSFDSDSARRRIAAMEAELDAVLKL
jgi:cell division protein ZapA